MNEWLDIWENVELMHLILNIRAYFHIFIFSYCIVSLLCTVKDYQISATADGGPCSQVRARETLRSAPHRH